MEILAAIRSGSKKSEEKEEENKSVEEKLTKFTDMDDIVEVKKGENKPAQKAAVVEKEGGKSEENTGNKRKQK
jgi:hypothetical protein